ncbi:MAG: hypothetical protein O9320_18795 [Magnetospirillum sp.]|nr:hypothetical protein [Magnetospirillum sp.]
MSAVEPVFADLHRPSVPGAACAAWLLWSLRRLDGDPGGDWDVQAFWQHMHGEAGSFEIVSALARLLSVLRIAARRRLQLGGDDAAAPTAHEASLLAALRAVEGGDAPRCEAHLLWLARGPARADLRAALDAVAASLQHGT